MIFEYYFFDLDDTLYEYTKIHNDIICILCEKYNLNYDYCKHIINNTANLNFKHNKLFYFNYELTPIQLNNIYNEYNEYILNNIKLYDGVFDLIKYIKTIGKKVGIITNNSLEIQLKKLQKLDILDYIDNIVTSDEAQYEKPHKNIYQLALGRINMKKDEVCMIGDNLEHDILGSINFGIFAYYFNNGNNGNNYIIHNNYIEFPNYIVLADLFKKIYIYLNDFIKLSIKYGQHIGLTQYNGGNVSIKCDDIILIKSSGYELGNMNKNAISYINNKELIKINDEKINIPIIYGKKPSIECYFHSILKKYVVHIHPALINGILCDMNATKIINNTYIKYKILILDYIKPGIDIKKQISKMYNSHDIIFLLNHGIIVHSDNIVELDNIICYLFNKFNIYDIVNSIIINNMYSHPICVYRTYNTIIIEKLSNTFLDICPDYTLYLKRPLIFENMDDFISNFDRNNLSFICKINDIIYIISENIRECKKIEDIYCAYLLTISNIYTPNLLDKLNINSIINNVDEIYRKSL
jgi:HAD superfamily hydrolase (TIGR01549 family)